MDELAALFATFGEDPLVTAGVLLALAGALGAVVVANAVRQRQEMRRRAGGDGTHSGASAKPPDKQKVRSFDHVVSFIEANLGGDARQNRVLRLQLIQAGFFDQRAVALYFGARLGMALLFGVGGLLGLPFLFGDNLPSIWMWTAAMGVIGYLAPTFYLKRRIAARVTQHRSGFPDFMDLMVVCAEAGLSMEAAIERIARELVEGYPSLAENLYMVSLEIRAGKPFAEALERMGERLGIEEATMLATLLQQSAELGTSLSHSLRVYSDEMRNKRLSRAEEKAYSLPAKLTVPLILFVFPVLLFVLMLPVVIRVSQAFGS